MLFGLNAVDELDRTAFGILLPEIRDEFGLDLQGILGLVAVVTLVSLLLQVPVAAMADRGRRVLITAVGALGWAMFSVLTGLASSLLVLAIARSGSGIGKAVVEPTHNSLLADYYDIPSRARVYSFHRAANAVGAFIGPLAAGLMAAAWGWRAPFFVYAIPTLVFVVLATRLREPIRGLHERRAMGLDETAACDRGAQAVVRRGVAHRQQDRDAAAHLLGVAVPRRLAHRLRQPRRPACTRRSSASTSAPEASRPLPSNRPSSSASSSAPASAPACSPRARTTSCGSCPTSPGACPPG